jgi:hypothetical protein
VTRLKEIGLALFATLAVLVVIAKEIYNFFTRIGKK